MKFPPISKPEVNITLESVTDNMTRKFTGYIMTNKHIKLGLLVSLNLFEFRNILKFCTKTFQEELQIQCQFYIIERFPIPCQRDKKHFKRVLCKQQ